MIRSARPDDTEPIITVAMATGLFQPDEADFLRAMLGDGFGAGPGGDRRCLVDDTEGAITGVAYYAREDLADGVWNLYLLAVHPDRQGQGVGGRLVRSVEDALRSDGERMLLVETSSLEEFTKARSLYARLAFTEEARIRDYYAKGDHKVVFRKLLSG